LDFCTVSIPFITELNDFVRVIFSNFPGLSESRLNVDPVQARRINPAQRSASNAPFVVMGQIRKAQIRQIFPHTFFRAARTSGSPPSSALCGFPAHKTFANRSIPSTKESGRGRDNSPDQPNGNTRTGSCTGPSRKSASP